MVELVGFKIASEQASQAVVEFSRLFVDRAKDMSASSGRQCWAKGCRTRAGNSRGLQLFRFPSDRTLLKQWCLNSGRSELLSQDRASLHQGGAALCERHFKKSQFMPLEPKQLLWNAVPTVFPLPMTVSKQQAKQSEEPTRGDPTRGEPPSVNDYEMAALPTFGRERLVGIARKQWHEIKRLRTHVRSLEKSLASGLAADETYLLDVLSRNLEGTLLDRVVDIIVGDLDCDDSEQQDA
ncbi:uncharacterized protein LOC8041913 [Ixodes scapularis]|uniref:uncharacterized protein LOC8041913 n=1 Tax=Ixodes scapularis TaxID=6945 RepID=UPI001C382164|nr:uncharacterized protein LOC8041913 [Ixodes scapularis]